MREIHADQVNHARIAIVRSFFNEDVTEKLLVGAIKILDKFIGKEHITVVHVPGAIEIPLVVKKLLLTSNYDAVIALGAVIRGETSHYDYVCQQVSQGCQQIMLEFNKPVIFGVLTTEDEEQALARVGGSHGHKGEEAALAALEMIAILRQIESQPTVERINHAM